MPVGPCKTESSQKPVPIHPLIVEALVRWREIHRYRKLDDGFSRAAVAAAEAILGQAILRIYIRPKAQELRSREEVRMAHLPTRLLDSLEERGH